MLDAFTEERFKGNNAAVVITTEWLTESLMQAIATENNLSETAFVVQSASGCYHIRWYSPMTEIAFCGHATLAAAYVIFTKMPELQSLQMSAKAVGEFTVSLQASGFIEMNFPNTKPVVCESTPKALLEGLSIQPAQVLINDQAYFAIYPRQADVFDLKQNNDLLKTLAPYDVVVTAPGEQYDFFSRYFWPANGGDEDPVTGSIHTGLAPFWAEQLNKTALVAYQASKRGGELFCRVEKERVFIAGKVVPYLEGVITL